MRLCYHLVGSRSLIRDTFLHMLKFPNTFASPEYLYFTENDLLTSFLLHIVVAYECESAGIAARTLGNIADMLGCMAADKGGLRSGPAGNRAWLKAFQYLEVCQLNCFDYNL